MKRPTIFVIILYSLTVIMLGIMGYQAGSTISLIISSIFGGSILALLLTALFLKKIWPGFLILIATVALLSFFIFRFSITRNFMPAIMAIFSALVAILMTIWIASRKKLS
jgi:uncharacterized membrane protein (UPF0136 family)